MGRDGRRREDLAPVLSALGQQVNEGTVSQETWRELLAVLHAHERICHYCSGYFVSIRPAKIYCSRSCKDSFFKMTPDDQLAARQRHSLITGDDSL